MDNKSTLKVNPEMAADSLWSSSYPEVAVGRVVEVSIALPFCLKSILWVSWVQVEIVRIFSSRFLILSSMMSTSPDMALAMALTASTWVKTSPADMMHIALCLMRYLAWFKAT